MCTNHALKMKHLVLAGKSGCDVRDLSRALNDICYDFFGVDAMDFTAEAEDCLDSEVKPKAQTAFLRHMLQEPEDGQVRD